MRRAALVLLLALPLRTGASDEWTSHDLALEAAFAAAVLVDVRLTSTALASGRRELNPLLGSRPSDAKLAGAAALAIGAHALVSAVLPARHRRWWQAVSLVAEATAVGHNFSVGARF